MDLLIGILIVVEVLVSLLLILIILIQPSKSGGGLGGALGGGGGAIGEQLFGARTGNVLTKGTIIFASVFLLNTVALAFLYSQKSSTPPVTPPGPVLTESSMDSNGADASDGTVETDGADSSSE